MSEATFTFRVDEELKNAFFLAAKSRDRTGAQLLRDFMREFVQKKQEETDYDIWFREQVQRGFDDVARGNLVSNEEVEKNFSARREQLYQRMMSEK